MQIKPLNADQSRNKILSEVYVIREFSSIDELIELYLDFKKKNIGKSILLTLDDLGQAEYTSSHSISFNDIDDLEGHDLSNIDAAAFEDGEHIGYLSTPSEFFIRKENFLKMAATVNFSNACERDLTMDENEMSILEDIHKNPINFLDEFVLLKIVPVEKSYEAICGFPNGYFSCDLSPFENYAVAKLLNEKYDFELFGIGASLLGFIRKNEMSDEKAEELVADLMKLYNSEDVETANKMLNLVKKQNHLFLKYTESLE